MNPTNDVLEKRLAALDGGAAGLAFASGQAAITAAMLTITHSGQNFISSTSLYGGTWTLFTQTFKKLGIEVRFFDPDHPEQIAKLADENTRAVYLESLGNPKNDVPDFRKIADTAHRPGLPVIVDNTVLTPPPLLRPIEHGADIVVYSTTKFLGGHGVHIGGAIVDSGTVPLGGGPAKWPEFTAPDPAYHGVVFTEALKPIGNIAYIIHIRTHWLRDTGACMSPFAAFLFLLGIETLHLRMAAAHGERPGRGAVAREAPGRRSGSTTPACPATRTTPTPRSTCQNGAGAIIGFGIRGGEAAGIKFINSVKLASHLANIGDAKTLVIHPASTTHSQLTRDGAGRHGRDAGVHPPVGRHRGRAGHHRRPGPGPEGLAGVDGNLRPPVLTTHQP